MSSETASLPATTIPVMDGSALYVVDDVTVKPGAGEAFLDAYMARYVPGAQARGLRLVSRLVSPPVWLQDQSNRLLFVWAAAGAGDVWASKFAGRTDPLLAAWWTSEAAPYIESRSRSVFSDAANIGALGDV